MCQDSVPHRLSVKLPGPGPLHFEFLNMFTALYRNIVGSTFTWWLGLFGRRLCRHWGQKVFGNPVFLWNVPSKIQLTAKTVTQTPRALFAHTMSVSEFNSLPSSVVSASGRSPPEGLSHCSLMRFLKSMALWNHHWRSPRSHFQNSYQNHHCFWHHLYHLTQGTQVLGQGSESG